MHQNGTCTPLTCALQPGFTRLEKGVVRGASRYMRSFKSGLIAFTVAALVGTVALIGCTAEGSSEVIDDPSEPDASGNTLPASNPTPPPDGSTPPKDAGKDVTKSDAAKDAGPPPPSRRGRTRAVQCVELSRRPDAAA